MKSMKWDDSSKEQYLKIGSSKYEIISVESTDDVITELIVSDTKTKNNIY